jgi:hypothetical protein
MANPVWNGETRAHFSRLKKETTDRRGMGNDANSNVLCATENLRQEVSFRIGSPKNRPKIPHNFRNLALILGIASKQ